MKKYTSIVAFLLLSLLTVQAQTISPLDKGKELLEQLNASLDAAAFLNSWTSQQRSQWHSELSNAQDAVALAKSISSLSEFIKPGKFKEQFSLAQLKSLTSGTKNYGDVANALRTLESGLTADAFSNGWVSAEADWLAGLQGVK